MRPARAFHRLSLFLIVFIFAATLPAKSIRFVKTISLQKKGTDKNVATFLLGKKKAQKSIHPSSLCRLDQKRICITDAVNGIVMLLDNQGKILKKIDRIKGIKLVAPVNVCIDDRSSLYVSDSALHAVLKLDSRLKFQNLFIQSSDIRITGLLFNQGRFYGVDTPNHRIICFDRSGKQLFAFGGRGTGPLRFNYPTHIAADEQYLYITDALNFRVQIVTLKGKFVRAFGTMGRGGGNFAKPKGIAVDNRKRIYVADAIFDNIQIFDMDGRFLYYFGGPGHGDGQFWMPTGLMTDPDNTVWVADTYNNRLQLFHPQEDTP